MELSGKKVIDCSRQLSNKLIVLFEAGKILSMCPSKKRIHQIMVVLAQNLFPTFFSKNKSMRTILPLGILEVKCRW